MRAQVRRRLASWNAARRILMPVFAKVNPGDITTRHAITRDPVRLHSFRHRGFWFHGRDREAHNLAIWQEFIDSGDVVVDVGAHIGYLTMLFSRLTGPSGQVIAFEPGANNLPYLLKNTHGMPNVVVETTAIGAETGSVTFYLEDLSGQNNSLSSDYEAFASTTQSAHSHASYHATQVQMTTLDTYCREHSIEPDWIKIDVEGHEIDVLTGAHDTLEQAVPAITLEITRHSDAVADLLTSSGYLLIDPRTRQMADLGSLSGDYLALHPTQHRELLTRLGIHG